jgi:nicotinate dehydrogenase subunit B
MSPDSTPLPTRREFLRRMGGGILVFVSLRELLAAQAVMEGVAQARWALPGLPTDFNAFIRIGGDGRVTGFTGKIEMGQGPMTSLGQMLADELEVPLDSVDMVMGDTELCPFDMGTWGSMTTRFFGPALRAAAAEAKGVLLQLAAEALGLPRARLAAKEGFVFDREDEARRVSYGALAKGRRIERRLDVGAKLKEFAEYTVMGRSVPRRDGREKVTGAARYAGDMRLPGMLYAKVLRPPAHGATLKSVDTTAAERVAGVRVVREGDLVAVLHELPDTATAAFLLVRVEFDLPTTGMDDRNIFDHLLRVAPGGDVVAQGGDLSDGAKRSSRKFETTYLNSYVAHVPIETHAALAHVEGAKATVWASTQNPFGARDQIAKAIGLPVEAVRVIVPFVGGGFGGKTVNGQAVEAARLAKAAGRPVQVMRSRADEFFHDPFRPAAITRVRSGIDAGGKMAFWDYDDFYGGGRGAEQFYTVPNHRTSVHGSDLQGPPGAHPFATGAWRAPGNSGNTFARESQIDTMAAAAGIDPVEFRLRNLEDPRMIRVLKAAAEKFGWTPARSPSRRGLGVACSIDAGTYVAAMAEAEVDARDGRVRVRRVVCAQDMGIVINPEGARMQMEGGIVMGLGYALSEEVHFSDGRILDTNFGSYRIPTFSWVPKIEAVLVENNQLAPQGGGEPAITVVGAIVANAIHDATGARVLRLPMSPDRVRAALA